MVGFEFTVRGGTLDRLSAYLKKGPADVEKDFRRAALFVWKTIKSNEFMAVRDGSTIVSKSGKKYFPKRTKSPGVRSVTGTLRRSVSDANGLQFRNDGKRLEAAIGTDLKYGAILESRTRYKFLRPGLDAAMPTVRKLLGDAFRSAFKVDR